MQYVGLPIDPPATIRGRVRWPHTTYYQVLVRVPVMYFHDMDGNVSTVHELYTWYMYTYHYEKGARSHPYDMSSRAFVHARM